MAQRVGLAEFWPSPGPAQSGHAWGTEAVDGENGPSPVAERTQREEILLHGGLTCFSLPELLGDRQHEGSPTCQPVGGPVAWARLVPLLTAQSGTDILQLLSDSVALSAHSKLPPMPP